MSRAAAKPRRRAPGQAARPAPRIRKRLSRRLPSPSRILAVLLFATLVGGLVTLVNGPWLRVSQVAHAGASFTPAGELQAVLDAYLSHPLLTLDSAGLEARLQELPAVAEARVRAKLPNRLSVTIVEKVPAATWLTPAARLVLAADGAVIASLGRGDELPAELQGLPAVDDQRSQSRQLRVGDAVPVSELRAAERLLALDAELLGSNAIRFGVRIHDEYGFILVSARPAWRAALGFYQASPGESPEEAEARLEAQVAAVRTLFASQSEDSVSWVDARNPGKVYWAP